MVCRYCRAQIADNTSFCGKCGAEIINDDNITSPSELADDQDEPITEPSVDAVEPTTPKKPKKKMSKPLIICYWVLAIALVITVSIFVLMIYLSPPIITTPMLTPSPTPTPVPTPPPDANMLGAWNGNVYTNEYLGMQITVPPDFETIEWFQSVQGPLTDVLPMIYFAGDSDLIFPNGRISDEFWNLADEYGTSFINVMSAELIDSMFDPNEFAIKKATHYIRVLYTDLGFSNVDEFYNANPTLIDDDSSWIISNSPVRIGYNDWYLMHHTYTADWGYTISGGYVTVIDGITIQIAMYVWWDSESPLPENLLFLLNEMLSWVTSTP
jgi:hypothetical protein